MNRTLLFTRRLDRGWACGLPVESTHLAFHSEPSRKESSYRRLIKSIHRSLNLIQKAEGIIPGHSERNSGSHAAVADWRSHCADQWKERSRVYALWSDPSFIRSQSPNDPYRAAWSSSRRFARNSYPAERGRAVWNQNHRWIKVARKLPEGLRFRHLRGQDPSRRCHRTRWSLKSKSINLIRFHFTTTNLLLIESYLLSLCTVSLLIEAVIDERI